MHIAKGVSADELLAVPELPDEWECVLPVDELGVLARVVTEEPARQRLPGDLPEAIALRQAQWMATHVLRGWISGWSPRWRRLAIELVEDRLSSGARSRVMSELRLLKREVDGQTDAHLDAMFAERTMKLVEYFGRLHRPL